jgi:hypothetical protein
MTASASRRSQLRTVTGTGVFNFHTLSGNVVVNGIAATHYGKPAWTSAPRLATLWYHAVDAVSSVLGAEDASQNKVADDKGQLGRLGEAEEALTSNLRA